MRFEKRYAKSANMKFKIVGYEDVDNPMNISGKKNKNKNRKVKKMTELQYFKVVV